MQEHKKHDKVAKPRKTDRIFLRAWEITWIIVYCIIEVAPGKGLVISCRVKVDKIILKADGRILLRMNEGQKRALQCRILRAKYLCYIFMQAPYKTSD